MNLSLAERRHGAELLDEPELHLPDLAANLRDIRMLNRWFGGVASVLPHLRDYIQPGSTVRLLDVATGSGDIPIALQKFATARGATLSATGLDTSSDILSEAARICGGAIDLVQGDARSLKFPNDAFDIVTCCLALHHFSPDDAVQVLREMRRVSAGVVLVSDLYRARSAFLLTWLATRTVARGRLTRHDGPLSVLRAYTTAEMADLIREAGWQSPQQQRHAYFRQTVIAPRPPNA